MCRLQKRTRAVVRASALLLFLSPIVSGALRAQELQSWNEIDVAGVWHKVALLAPFVARTDSTLPNPQLAATGLTADFPLPAHLTFTGGYLFADLPQGTYHVHLPLVALTGTLPMGRLIVAGRSRFEKLLGYPTSPVRFRERLLIDCAFGRSHAFLDDEVFFNLSAGDFNQNRLQAGAGVHITPHLLFDLYYLQKNPSTGAAIHVVGATLRITVTHDRVRMLPAHNP